MAKRKCLVQVSVPGERSDNMCLDKYPEVQGLISALKKNNIEYVRCDSIMGWGNLNQDWIEFKCELETSWSWPRLLFMDDSEAEEFFQKLHHGRLLMMLSYIEEKDGKTEYVPYH